MWVEERGTGRSAFQLSRSRHEFSFAIAPHTHLSCSLIGEACWVGLQFGFAWVRVGLTYLITQSRTGRSLRVKSDCTTVRKRGL